MKVSEIFYSIQGEGATAGRPAIFLRLAGCNLQCWWCDTKYSWLFSEKIVEELRKKLKMRGIPEPDDLRVYDMAEETEELTVREVFNRILELEAEHHVDGVVITGGEPLLHQSQLAVLVDWLAEVELFVEIETNGTVRLTDETFLAFLRSKEFLRLNISPKLENSLNDIEKRAPRLLEEIDPLDYIVKFVVSSDRDIPEIMDIIEGYAIPEKKVWLMPLGKTQEEYSRNAQKVVDLCLKYGFNFSPRIHVQIWGDKRGV